MLADVTGSGCPLYKYDNKCDTGNPPNSLGRREQNLTKRSWSSGDFNLRCLTSGSPHEE